MTGRRGIRRQSDSTGTSFGRFGQNAVVSDDQYRKDRGHARGLALPVVSMPGARRRRVDRHRRLRHRLRAEACVGIKFRRPTPSTRCCPRRPKHVSGSECALIGLLENILAPLWVFARFGDVPSAWTVAGGALLLATLIGHEVAAREPVRVSQPGARGYRTVNNL